MRDRSGNPEVRGACEMAGVAADSPTRALSLKRSVDSDGALPDETSHRTRGTPKNVSVF